MVEQSLLRSGSRWLLALLSLPLLVGVAPAQTASEEMTLAPVDSLPLPAGLVKGLTWLDARTVVVLAQVPGRAAGSGKVFLHYLDRLGNVTRQVDFTGTLERGLAFDGRFLWSCGDDREGGSRLYKIEPDTCVVKEVFPTAGHHPCGVAWDGENLWIADRDSGRLDRYDLAQGSVTRSVLAPGFSPYGLAHLGRQAWVTDSGTGRLYRLTGPRLRLSGTADTSSFSFRGRDVVLAGDGTDLWFVPVGSAHAYRVRTP